jgi:hypothetical protein
MGPQEHRIERRLAAIFAADVAGYSRLVEQDETGTLRTLSTHREIMDRLITEYGGRIANTAGDSVLAEFPSAVDAVQCAVQVQNALTQAGQDTPAERRLLLRIGVHVGDMMVRDGAVLHGSDCARVDCTHSRNSSDTDGLRASKLKHVVKGMNCDGDFGGATPICPRAQAVPNHSFEAAYGRLHQSPASVPGPLLPAHASMLRDTLEMSIALGRSGLPILARHCR